MWKAIIYKVSLTAIFLFMLTCAYAGSVRAQASLMSKLRPEELIEKGRYYLINRNMPDSALFYNTLLTNKLLHKRTLTMKERLCMAMGYNRQGYINMFFKLDYSKAISNFLKAQEYCDDPSLQASIDQNIGHIYSLYAECYPTDNNLSAARYYYKSAFSIAEEKHLPIDMVTTFCAFWNLGIDKKNIEAFDKEITLFAQSNIPPNTPYRDYAHSLYKVVHYIKEKNYRGALNVLRNDLKRKFANGLEGRAQCSIDSYLATIYKMMGTSDSVLFYAKKLQTFGLRNKMLDVEVDACKLLLDYYHSKNDKEQARDYQLLYFQKRDSLLVMHNLNNVKSNYLTGNIKKLNANVESIKHKREVEKIVLIGIVMSVVIGFFGFFMYRRKRQISQKEMPPAMDNEVEGTVEKPKYINSSLEEDDKILLKQKIEKALATSDEVYNNDFTLERLAQLCGAHQKNISQVINEKFGCSFVILISEYRVNEACRRIHDDAHFGNLTLEAIGQSVGFKARESFSRAFKRITGMSPSDYQKNIKTTEK